MQKGCVCMNEDTIKLLRETDAGCKMAIKSMQQIQDYVEDEELQKLIGASIKNHKRMEKEIGAELHNQGFEEKEPNPAASAFSWMTTEMKLKLKDDNHQVSKILMDGCNMGIQGVSKYLNQYENASLSSKELAKRLVREEESLMKDLRKYI